jgi:3-methyladenine DNA glycosylase AlkD
MSVNIRNLISAKSNPKRARVSQGFFKTGPGQYGEGDIFLGLTVPQCREIAKQFSEMTLPIALLILVYNYEHDSENREDIFEFYVKNMQYVNNWDLVDLSAPNIFGRAVFSTGKAIPTRGALLFKLANSENLWEKRVAIVSTYYFIKNLRFDETFSITEILMKDKHDLIHKACGWMLREVGKKDSKALEAFLKKHYKVMPRTMLRYAIERFPEQKRQAYLKGKI